MRLAVRTVLTARGLVAGGRGVAVSLLVAPGAELGRRVLVDAGEACEVQEERGGQAAQAAHVERQRLAGLQVVKRRVAR